ncbi:MAG: hypothetical protein U0528_12445 [Anaerolineae bacterium]|nr:hypothetical protein [Anaerolineae bacterium]
MALTLEQAQLRRQIKIQDSMAEFAPIWLTNDTYNEGEQALVFELIYAHPHDGMIRERFRYDAFNDVLYHKGAQKVTEEEVLAIEDQAPYVDGDVLTRVPIAPRGRGT